MRAALLVFASVLYLFYIAWLLWRWRSYGQRADWNGRPQFSLAALVIVTTLLPPILYYLFQILSSISYITNEE